jgi:hypothetical protein
MSDKDGVIGLTEGVRGMGFNDSRGSWYRLRCGIVAALEAASVYARGLLNVVPLGLDSGGMLRPISVGTDGTLSATATLDSAFTAANKPGTVAFPAQVTVGGAGGVVATAFSAQACAVGAWIQALSTNTASVWIGGSDASATKGIELTPGTTLFFPCTGLSALKHLSTTTGQKVNLMAA